MLRTGMSRIEQSDPQSIHSQDCIRVIFKGHTLSLKLNIQKTNLMASGPITSWEIDGERVETVSDFIFLGSKITADGDCSHEIKRHLLLGRKVMTNLDSILKSRDITLPTKVHLWGHTESDTTEVTQQQQQQSRLWFFLWSCMNVRVGL